MDKIHESEKLGPYFPHVGLMYGQGDGGHGPNSEEVHRMRYYAHKKRVTFSTALNYWKQIESIKDQLPIWNAELYYELHRGTLTTQALMKKMNRWFDWQLTGGKS